MPFPLDLGLWVRRARAVMCGLPGRAFGELGPRDGVCPRCVPNRERIWARSVFRCTCLSAGPCAQRLSSISLSSPVLECILGDAWVCNSLPRQVLLYLGLSVWCVCVSACPRSVICDARILLVRRYVRVLFAYVLSVCVIRAP